MKRKRLAFGIIIIFLLIATMTGFFVLHNSTEVVAKNGLTNNIENFLTQRQKRLFGENNSADPFGEDNIVRILFIGIDKRAGQARGHCDAIQLIEINRQTNNLVITAVPRGTYSPLPYGVAATSSDYYVSNACGLVDLEYGVEQIEKILSKQADYIVVAGFSEVLGILRYLKLPTTQTLQWLRQRQIYAIGEPQRAHNHSTFLKQLLLKYTPKENSLFDIPLQYIVYKLVQTDLPFEETRNIIATLSTMELNDHPERITLAMRPAYAVQDIPYDEENVDTYIDSGLGSIKHLLSPDDYSGATQESVQEKLLNVIEEHKNDAEFISWAFENNLWLQIEDENKSQEIQYNTTISALSPN